MAKGRYKETSMNSFFGNFLYEQKVSKGHFLRKLNEVMDWDRFAGKLLGYYTDKGKTGQAPYNSNYHLKDTPSFLPMECLGKDSRGAG